MNGRHSATGSLWTAPAALTGALAVLFSAFAGLAAFLLGRLDVEWVSPPGNPPGNPPGRPGNCRPNG